ncbi:hypothetical protein DFJ74DRAFT_704058 [Hyaloraphidium curvatum]|nr:hypothetical protein DFJ74DRAFT_704058 [Hyaloraphidium curvatum]
MAAVQLRLNISGQPPFFFDVPEPMTLGRALHGAGRAFRAARPETDIGDPSGTAYASFLYLDPLLQAGQKMVAVLEGSAGLFSAAAALGIPLEIYLQHMPPKPVKPYSERVRDRFDEIRRKSEEIRRKIVPAESFPLRVIMKDKEELLLISPSLSMPEVETLIEDMIGEYFKNLAYCILTLDTPPSQGQIERLEALLPDQQRIVFAGKQLDDEKTLADCKIRTESTILLLSRLRGGMFHHSSGMRGYERPTEAAPRGALEIECPDGSVREFEFGEDDPVALVREKCREAMVRAEARAEAESKRDEALAILAEAENEAFDDLEL